MGLERHDPGDHGVMNLERNTRFIETDFLPDRTLSTFVNRVCLTKYILSPVDGWAHNRLIGAKDGGADLLPAYSNAS